MPPLTEWACATNSLPFTNLTARAEPYELDITEPGSGRPAATVVGGGYVINFNELSPDADFVVLGSAPIPGASGEGAIGWRVTLLVRAGNVGHVGVWSSWGYPT